MSRFQQIFPHSTQRLLFITDNYAHDKQLLEIGDELGQSLKAKYGFESFVNFPSQEHPHQNIADAISYFMKLLRGSLILMGMILILLTWLYPQIPDMGTMKSVGARHHTID